ncbi:MAG: class I SAM-dependent methyltransferase [Candidatus Nanopelagicales bacterium]
MNSLERDLAGYYDQDAAQRAQRTIDPERVRRREGFVDLLADEKRSTVLDIGVGPGIDAAALQARGLAVTGVDLSLQHTALSRSLGVRALVASALHLPFSDRCFDAAWSMSTLMHIPNRDIDAALVEIKRVMTPGALIALGMWGGNDVENEHEGDTIEPRRFFSWRSTERVQRMLAALGEIHAMDTWSGDTDPHIYQWFIVRV